MHSFPGTHVDIRGKLKGVSSLFPPSSPGYQTQIARTGYQESLPTEPYHWSLEYNFLTSWSCLIFLKLSLWQKLPLERIDYVTVSSLWALNSTLTCHNTCLILKMENINVRRILIEHYLWIYHPWASKILKPYRGPYMLLSGKSLHLHSSMKIGSFTSINVILFSPIKGKKLKLKTSRYV